MTEWNLEDALVLEREEGMEEGIIRGREEGIIRGREEGIEVGIESVARTALAEGAPLDFIHRITGLDIATIESLSASV